MAAAPLITFKAGTCTTHARRVTPVPTPGYLYIYSEDDLMHFCWRPRSAPSTSPEIDLLMVPTDGSFSPLVKNPNSDTNLQSPTTGRIFVLKFQSSSQKHYFWLQSSTQSREGDLSWFSQRDLRMGQIVDLLLQGEEVDVGGEMEGLGDGDEGEGNGDGDAMEVDEQGTTGGAGLSRQGSGGAGQDATGGYPRDEGRDSRDAGADGGRANQQTSALVQNFLASLNQPGSSSAATSTQPSTSSPLTLPDLLSPPTTLPYISSATPTQLDALCSFLPPELFLLAQESTTDPSSTDPEPTPAAAQAAIEALSTDQKRDILKRAFRSPQFNQSLGSLTVALRDGGLPIIGEALGLKGSGRGAQGGGEAVEGFVESVRRAVEEERESKGKK